MKYLPTIARYVYGLILFVFGLNKFLGFMPAPEFSEEANAFFGALMDTGYMIYFIGTVEVVMGILLLANRMVPLALVLIAPVTLNIIMFHLFLDLPSIVPGLLVFVLNLYLLFAYKKYYDPMLVITAEPGNKDSE